MWPFRKQARSASPAPEDFLWLTADERVRGVVAAVDAALVDTSDVLVVAHTEGLLGALAEAMMHEARNLDTLTGPATAHEITSRFRAQRAPVCILVSAADLRPASGAPGMLPRPIHLHIAERAVLRDRDDAVLRFVAPISPKRIAFHVSFDDPLLLAFCGDRQREMLRSLGVKAGESLSHPWLSKSLWRAQERIARRCPDPCNIDSWLESHIKR